MKTFDILKDFKGDNLKVINSIITRADAEENLYQELKRCIETVFDNPNEDKDFQHIPHVAVMLATLNSKRSLKHLIELVKIDIDYYNYFFDEINSECLNFVFYKMGKNNLEVLIALLKDESVHKWGLSYVLEGILAVIQTDSEARMKTLEDLKPLLDSNSMKHHLMRGIFLYGIEELDDLAMRKFKSSKIDPMDLSIDEVTAYRDSKETFKGYKTLEEVYALISSYESERLEYAWEMEDMDFF
ncbi:DUF1186 domain-containing protein [Propionigenium maris]|nr:DUF1186 domain-containing protein [Propionigenium maris]